MRSEEEIKNLLIHIERLLKCPECGTVAPEPYYDDELRCSKCKTYLKYGDVILYGVWITLRWILEKISTEELMEEIPIDLYESFMEKEKK